jgi:serine/threonine protein kinase
MADIIDKAIKPYKVRKEIGQSTFSVVYLICDPFDGIAALKRIKKIRNSKDWTVEAQNEVAIIKEITHPNIISLIDHFEDKDSHYMVLSFCEGGDLYSLVAHNKTRLEDEKTKQYFKQLVDALSYIHNIGIVHRDIKLENILLDLKQENVILTDFGFATRWSPDKKLDKYMGSPSYASPELMTGTPYYGPEVDIWALGCVLYAMITRTDAFSKRQNIIVGKFTSSVFLIEPSLSLIKGMFTVDSKQRFTMQQILKHPFIN